MTNCHAESTFRRAQSQEFIAIAGAPDIPQPSQCETDTCAQANSRLRSSGLTSTKSIRTGVYCDHISCCQKKRVRDPGSADSSGYKSVTVPLIGVLTPPT